MAIGMVAEAELLRLFVEGGVGSVALFMLYQLLKDSQKMQTTAILTMTKAIVAIDKGMALLQQEVEAHVAQVRDVRGDIVDAVEKSKADIISEIRRDK